ncbi:DUF5134 domain-containing protein [Streptomyces sp. NBC_00996]|uniref:DUF5134 domain-containing protein n=1 Tax=Streptomyces sp. NBC_00996 TaxID=2903710 RepID=UPI0038645F76
MLTALFLAAAIRALRYDVLSRSAGWRSRVDHFLHTAMALAMAVMPWNWGRILPEAPLTADSPRTAGCGRRTVRQRSGAYSCGRQRAARMTARCGRGGGPCSSP